ncbi:SseB family protein [Paracoccus xiamenensis]|uniref:SseB family protein n=1 Tax=Paracoccus xiamenensis TaxID=2714901 RepID=UPI00140D4157|nr:SseB family protein [Paracoccus xiamenensis]NHF71713.1 SseB family protein [Paracoccus xiamenensis]
MTPLDALCVVPFHDLSDAARARVLNRLADTEIFVALAGDPEGDRIQLRLFDLPTGRTAVAADTEDRLAEFFAEPVAHAALPGRALAAMLAAEGVALMVNPGAPSEMVLEPATLDWLARALQSAPTEDQTGPARLTPPAPEMVAALAEPLAARLSDMAGLADGAALVAAEWTDGARGHLIVLSGVADERRPLLAKALAELIAFLPPLPQPCDVAFDLAVPENALLLRLDPVQPAPAPKSAPRAPGSDPDKPPILRF